MSSAGELKPEQILTSPLLEKALQLGLILPLDLERLAVARGCDYYERALPPRVPPLGKAPLSNEELAIALLSPQLHPTAREIRLSAALVGAEGIQLQQVASLAVQENCAPTVRYIAQAGHRYEPENPFWSQLLELLPPTEPAPDTLPHPTRFVEMTGIVRGNTGLFTRWIRPFRRQAA